MTLPFSCLVCVSTSLCSVLGLTSNLSLRSLTFHPRLLAPGPTCLSGNSSSQKPRSRKHSSPVTNREDNVKIFEFNLIFDLLLQCSHWFVCTSKWFLPSGRYSTILETLASDHRVHSLNSVCVCVCGATSIARQTWLPLPQEAFGPEINARAI